MVAVIKKGQSLSRTLNYNEQKVQQGDAECIHAMHYPKDLERLNFHDKLNRLQHQAALNTNVKANSVHISLNFDPSDNLEKEELCAIAGSYMQQIGFGKQPYLVYEHHDAGHPHIHIVTTNVQANGRRIDMNNIGRNQSETARKAIELSFGLTQAEGRNTRQEHDISIPAEKVQYGHSETRRAMQNVLDHVIGRYKFTSLPELNVVLKQYNMLADRGQEGGRIYNNRGLVYRVLDEQGNKIGVPIKASSFYNKPTLVNLEKFFSKNEVLRQSQKWRLKNAIDTIIRQEKPDIILFRELLEKESIHAEFRQNEQGKVYGITYIDYRTRCVFNGSDLGKPYSAKAIVERCNSEGKQLALKQTILLEQIQLQKLSVQQKKIRTRRKSLDPDLLPKRSRGMERAVEVLLAAKAQDEYMPYEWLKKKRKKKGRSL